MIGRWAESICGIGPIISAGLHAYVDVEKSACVSSLWRFSGFDPTCKWEKKEKRSFNANLKTLCYLIGESFVKVSNNNKDFYGKFYRERKDLEWSRNLSGQFAEQAERELGVKRFGEDAAARMWYGGEFSPVIAAAFRTHGVGFFTGDTRNIPTVAELKNLDTLKGPTAKRYATHMTEMDLDIAAEYSGVKMLPPAHIHSRARRIAIKMFLSHYWEVAYEIHYGKRPPVPYVIEHMGHVHQIPPPNWPMVETKPAIKRSSKKVA
jgi:hypothetical protein